MGHCFIALSALLRFCHAEPLLRRSVLGGEEIQVKALYPSEVDRDRGCAPKSILSLWSPGPAHPGEVGKSLRECQHECVVNPACAFFVHRPLRDCRIHTAACQPFVGIFPGDYGTVYHVKRPCVDVQPLMFWESSTCAMELETTNKCAQRRSGNLTDGYCAKTCGLCDIQASGQVFNRSVLGNLRDKFGVPKLRVTHDHMVADVQIGMPPQAMRCLIDASSADFWVPSANWNLTSTGSRANSSHSSAFFNAQESSTFALGTVEIAAGEELLSVHVKYANGQVTGFPAQDTLTFGSVTLPNQYFVVVEEADLPVHKSWDGICGLGWQQSSKSRAAGVPFYRHLHDYMGHAVIYLVPPPSSQILVSPASSTTSQLIKMETLVWSQAEPLKQGAQLTYWVTSGGLAVREAKPHKVRFLIDMGVPFLLAPPRYYLTLVRSLLAEDVFSNKCGIDTAAGNMIVCHCSVVDTVDMWPLHVFLGDRAFVLGRHQLFEKVTATDGGDLCLLKIQQNPLASLSPQEFAKEIDWVSMHSIQTDLGNTGDPSEILPTIDSYAESGHGEPFKGCAGCSSEASHHDVWVLGAAFLDHFVVIFDYDKQVIGFAEPMGTPDVTPIPAATQRTFPPLVLEPGPVLPPSWGRPTGHREKQSSIAWGTCVFISCGILTALVSLAIIYARSCKAVSARDAVWRADMDAHRAELALAGMHGSCDDAAE